jgi:hypothetical protein
MYTLFKLISTGIIGKVVIIMSNFMTIHQIAQKLLTGRSYIQAWYCPEILMLVQDFNYSFIFYEIAWSCHYLITYYSRYQPRICIIKSPPSFEPFHDLVNYRLAYTIIATLNCDSSVNIISFHTPGLQKIMITDRCPSWKHNVYISVMLKVSRCCHSQNDTHTSGLCANGRSLLLLQCC